MAQYLIGVVGEPDYATLTNADLQQIMEDVDVVLADLRAEGVFVFAGGLGRDDTASVVDATTGETVVTDGPFTESKETMGGFTIVEAPDLATAQKWAARFSAACRCPQEVRPIVGPPEVDGEEG
ncbi:MAG: YciI family protein [Nocardioides sp.]|uniref:YciI family protein n=1 Tax=Nocardioides sp. TaxID=35761 RepID=UPI0039E2C875